MQTKNDCFIPFKSDISKITLPQKFTFPFYYTPHPLSEIASKELQQNIIQNQNWEHNFWEAREGITHPIGKMFGVLVVKNITGELGYLAAFSGKIAETNHHPYFVPPIFNLWDNNPYYLEKSTELKNLSKQLTLLEQNEEYLALLKKNQEKTTFLEGQIIHWKKELKGNKKARDLKRKESIDRLSASDYMALCEQLKIESFKTQYQVKKATAQLKQELSEVQQLLSTHQKIINELKVLRKAKSQRLQEWIFEQYSFLNAFREKQDLLEIFEHQLATPIPSGAGECAAPKLLQYAYLNQLQPIALAEFWWGASPQSEIRKHLHFYPACRSKCEPILGHMLKGLQMDENPLLKEISLDKVLPIIFEDEWIVAVNKPADMLSVPGIQLKDSALTRMQISYPDCKSPLLLHRLDMSTSGVLLFAKDKAVHQNLQAQFIRRKIKKEYLAILDGIPKGEKGEINFPIRVDLDDRPRQLLCYEYGKKALTEWELVKVCPNNTALIKFFPITGRTHQLRVHASHPAGLNTPIKGDDLYGTKGKRLYLHAEKITFFHPIHKTIQSISAPCDFT